MAEELLSYQGFAYVYDTFMDDVPYGEWGRLSRKS